MMTASTRDKLIDLFWDGILYTPWDVWCDTSSGDKERIVVDAILELDEVVDTDEAYELFWEWADSLEEEDFFSNEEYEDEDTEDYSDYSEDELRKMGCFDNLNDAFDDED